jgi:hypothetical protein
VQVRAFKEKEYPVIAARAKRENMEKLQADPAAKITRCKIYRPP